jgi:imidazole glycerol-phosphate synthase subunit HisH
VRPPVALLDYGVGNLHSAAKALDRAGADVRVVTRTEDATGSAGMVVPGVGAYGACLKGLGQVGGAEALRGWIDGGRPLLGVCVGMQLLFEASAEGPVGDGVGALPGIVARIAPGVKIPHIGWDEVEVTAGSRLFAGLPSGTRFYFVHSYAAPATPGTTAATCDYGGTWAAAVERGNLFGTQFHPEKSAAAGLALLTNFVEACR